MRPLLSVNALTLRAGDADLVSDLSFAIDRASGWA